MTGDPALRRRLGRLLRAVHWVRAEGLSRVPVAGPVILAMTHCGVRGALVLESLLQREVVFIASGRFLRFPLVRGLALRLGGLFVSPADMLGTRLFDEAADALRGGSLLGVMVQGRQMDPDAGATRRGAAYLAYRLGADILPVRVCKRGLVLRIRVGELLPRPPSLRAGAINQTMAAICAQLGLAWVAPA